MVEKRVNGVADRLITMTPVISNVASSPQTADLYYAVKCGLVGDSTYGPQSSGGWQIVDRPKSVAATQWFDRSPYSLSFTGILQQNLDSAPGEDASVLGVNMSVESWIQQMESWVDRVVGSTQMQPPVLTISGPVPGIERLWVVYSITWKNALRHPQAGYRYQQEFDIVLYEYTSPLNNTLSQYNANSPAATFLTQSSSTAAENAGTQQYALYTIKKGDTLESIVSKLYNNSQNPTAQTISKVGTILLAINGIRDETLIPGMTGRVIKLPRDITGNPNDVKILIQSVKK
jgi:hypothetical protein